MNDVKSLPSAPLNSVVMEHLPCGGFVVRDAGFLSDPGRFASPLYACSEIEEMMHWVTRAMTGTGLPR